MTLKPIYYIAYLVGFMGGRTAQSNWLALQAVICIFLFDIAWTYILKKYKINL